MGQIVLTVVSVACFFAAVLWGRSTRLHRRAWQRIDHEYGPDSDAAVLARAGFRKEMHATTLYTALRFFAAARPPSCTDHAVGCSSWSIFIPVGLSVAFGRDFLRDARLSEERSSLERRAEEVLSPGAAGPAALGRRGSRPRTCPTSPASSSAGSTRPAPA